MKYSGKRLSGLLSERPSATAAVDSIYYATDTELVYKSAGGNWVERPNPPTFAYFNGLTSVANQAALPDSESYLGWAAQALDTNQWYEGFRSGWAPVDIGGGGSLSPNGVVAGQYENAKVTVDENGLVTAIEAGSAPSFVMSKVFVESDDAFISRIGDIGYLFGVTGSSKVVKITVSYAYYDEGQASAQYDLIDISFGIINKNGSNESSIDLESSTDISWSVAENYSVSVSDSDGLFNVSQGDIIGFGEPSGADSNISSSNTYSNFSIAVELESL